MKRVMLLLAMLNLAACGAETATTAAAIATTKAEEAKAGKQLEDKLKADIEQATQLNQQHLQATEQAGQ